MTIELYVPIANPALWWALGGVVYFIVALFVGRWLYRVILPTAPDRVAAVLVSVGGMLLLPLTLLALLVMAGNKPKR